MTVQPSDMVLRFAKSIGRPKEAQFYLELFSADQDTGFAILHVSAALSVDALEALAADIVYLVHLGLLPVVAAKASLREALHARLRSIPTRNASADTVGAAIHRGALPLVETAELADVAALAIALRSRKVILCGPAGALSLADGAPLSLIDVTTEFDDLSADGAMSEEGRAHLVFARDLLGQADHRLTITVTSPVNLLRELFTIRGAGTLMRRGATVARYTSFDSIDRDKLSSLLEAAFGSPPRDALFARSVDAILVADDYRGVALVESTPPGPYLSKFAVSTAAQGEGIGRDVWRALTAEFDTLLWRSRSQNPINRWYEQACDGMFRTDRWQVFWRGLPPAALSDAIEYASSKPADFD